MDHACVALSHLLLVQVGMRLQKRVAESPVGALLGAFLIYCAGVHHTRVPYLVAIVNSYY